MNPLETYIREIYYIRSTGAATPETGQAFELGLRLQDALAGGGCAAVICNTVGRAQETLPSFKTIFPRPGCRRR